MFNISTKTRLTMPSPVLTALLDVLDATLRVMVMLPASVVL